MTYFFLHFLNGFILKISPIKVVVELSNTFAQMIFFISNRLQTYQLPWYYPNFASAIKKQLEVKSLI